MTTPALEAFNAYFWITANVLVAYIGAMLVIFLVAYYILFDPRATTAGRFLYRFALSLLGVVILIFIGTWLDPVPGRAWNEYPGDVLWWRPLLRFVSYLAVAYTVSGLNILLFVRKYWPHLLRTSQDRDLIKPRHDK